MSELKPCPESENGRHEGSYDDPLVCYNCRQTIGASPTNDGEGLIERLTKALKATTARCAQYADYIRYVAKADELECHPYLPQLDEEVAEALAALNQGAGQ